MSRSYTPGLKVLSHTKIVTNRLLPIRGEVHYKVGDTVLADDIVASTEIPGNVGPRVAFDVPIIGSALNRVRPQNLLNIGSALPPKNRAFGAKKHPKNFSRLRRD